MKFDAFTLGALAAFAALSWATGCAECERLEDCPSPLVCTADGECVEVPPRGGGGEGEGEGEEGEGEEGEGEGEGEGEPPPPPGCGNDVVDDGEACDDGNNFSGDGCAGNCAKIEVCGDAVVDAREDCDDGNLVDGDGCNAECDEEDCGDGIVQVGLGEACDDGNGTSGDGCSACSLEFCGDGAQQTQTGEECDDENNVDGDGCSASCILEYCGDNALQEGIGEVCDDGNTQSGDGCAADCRSIEVCGNGILEGGAGGEDCDDGGTVDDDGCSSECNFEVCGDGIVQPSRFESCDDGALFEGDGCSNTCQGRAVALVVDEERTCSLALNGTLRCWGFGFNGALGYGPDLNLIGDNETPSDVGDVPLAVALRRVELGESFTCGLLRETPAVRCWGSAPQVGSAGPDQFFPDQATDVPVGGDVASIGAGDDHVCAVLAGGALRCWGANFSGQLGYGSTEDVGDDEFPSEAGDVDVGGAVVAVVGGATHTCALLDDGAVRCWGAPASSLGNPAITATVGDNELPSSSPTVDLGGVAVQIVAGDRHTCALLDDGAVRCWGSCFGACGYPGESLVESPATAGNVDVGAPVIALAAGASHTCALLEGGAARCWGDNFAGQLGYGNTLDIGDDEPPSAAGDIDVGEAVLAIDAGERHTCALTASGQVACWGGAFFGALGYGDERVIGDDELPSEVGTLPLYD